MNVCQLRGLNVPPGTDHERRTMASDELIEEWSEKKLSMEFDFWEMESGQATSDAFNVNILAASRPWVAQLWHDCRRTGLDCWAIDGTPLAMARALGLVGRASAGRRALAVDWGYSNTTLCLVGDDRPLYSRRIYGCAFGRVLNAIMDRFSVQLDEAQHLADTQGLTSSESTNFGGDQPIQAAITDAASETLDELVRQLSRTLQFMESQRRHLHPTDIWLMGGGAAMRNVGGHLSDGLKLPVQIWQLPSDAAAVPSASSQRAAMFGGAAALSALAWRAA
jgi:Tfp pilus assembly PilM family ATPase